MNILIIPSWYPSKGNRLSGSFFREQAIALKNAGHHVIVLNVTYQDRHRYFDPDNFKFKKFNDEGVIVYSYVTPAFGINRVKKLMIKSFLRRTERMFRKILQDEETVDIIHAHSYMPAGYCACELGKKNNIPVVITEHSSSIIQNNMSSIEIFYLKKCVELSSAFICVGEGLKQSVIKKTGAKQTIEVLPNIVSPLFEYKGKKGNTNKFIFCSVGNLNAGKRFGLTIDAFTKAFKGKSHIKLQIVGGGTLYSKLKEQIDNLGMNEQISLLGAMSREKVAQQMQVCDVFVLASAFETFGVVYIEAMACGKPVIGTRNGGADYIINKENGILIDVDNVNQLTEALEEMVENYRSYNMERISQNTIKQYSEVPVTSRLNIIYERCIKGW
ncbi:glycosyltransferase [Bacillus sp. JJ1532]|uniref:glycosyltransferase n=1 Tax=Bacillus sp. JJ1532 TaxID=3122958 RepID=UPI002FFF5D0D